MPRRYCERASTLDAEIFIAHAAATHSGGACGRICADGAERAEAEKDHARKEKMRSESLLCRKLAFRSIHAKHHSA